jgi:LysR family transcriptional regulator, benzoate and cis,cis-muconate-responsive activator of ben and cat genes
VVSVGTVFGLQLPVAVVHVGRSTAQDFETLRRLVDDQIDDLGGFAQVLDERHDIRVEAAEQEAAIGFEASDLCQIVRAVLVEPLGVSRPFGVLHFQQLAGVREGPAVEGAGKDHSAAALEAAEHSTAVTARVNEGVQFAIATACNEDGLAAHIGGEVIIFVGDLTLVREIDPVSLEDVLHFELEDLRVGENVSGDSVAPALVLSSTAPLSFCWILSRICRLLGLAACTVFASLCGATSCFRRCESKTKLVGTIPWRYRLELRQLRYFVAVARERNFTRAAEALRIAQPPLSRQIQQLEDELGVTLIERGSRPVRLTDGGRLLYEQAVQVLERVEETKAIARRLQDAGRLRFSFGFVPSTLYGYLPEVIRRYRGARPGVELTLLELTTLEQIAALKEGRIDVGFGRIPFDDPLVERRVLRNEKLIAALPSGHPLAAYAGPLRLNMVAGEPLVVYPNAPRPSYADQVLMLYREHGLKPPVLHEVREVQTALGLVAAGAGVCLVPASLERLRRDNVEYRPLAEEKAVSPIIMSTRKGDKSPEITLILKLIRDIYRKEGITFAA